MTVADWALSISILSFIFAVISTISRSVESKSTRRISIFSATTDKYVAQITETLLAFERQCEEALEEVGTLPGDARKKIHDAANRARRTTARFLNTILANGYFETNGWQGLDDPFDDIMENAITIRDSTDSDAIAAKLSLVVNSVSSIRARAFEVRDKVMVGLVEW